MKDGSMVLPPVTVLLGLFLVVGTFAGLH